jgi:hypothetical protein
VAPLFDALSTHCKTRFISINYQFSLPKKIIFRYADLMKRRFARDLHKKPNTTQEILIKLSRLALLYAAEEPENISTVRLYRDQIKSGEIDPPKDKTPPEESWVLQLGFRRLDETWVDAELARLTRRSLPTRGTSTSV